LEYNKTYKETARFKNMTKKKNMVKREKKVIEEEIFDVKKDGEEKIIRKEIFEEEKIPPKEQIKKENKIFITVIVIMTFFILLFLGGYIIINSLNHFEYEGVKFAVIKVGELILYDTFIPVTFNNTLAEYHFYLRTDPRILKNVPAEDVGMKFRGNMVLNMTQDFKCEGYGIIAIANFLKLQEIIGTKVIRDDNATCDDVYGKYEFVKIQPGNETKITEFGLSGGCYNIDIKDCEILKGTEKFMLETFVELKKRLD
jgi:hypothetical protein